MASTRPAQIAIRSDYVRRRADELSRTTGMTVTRIIEEALARYAPPVPIKDDAPPGMIREGRLLVLTGGPRITVEQVNASIEETRNGVRD
ncbi:MAG: hypothetical protein ACRYG4_06620 [Janthinobacterium lividum]